jgi:LDH2 family malate/lactate/ureidoglycolate dehydrogenase
MSTMLITLECSANATARTLKGGDGVRPALDQGYKGFGLCVFTEALSAALSDRRFASVHLNP